MGQWVYKSKYSSPLHYLGVSDQLHVPATLSPVSLDRRLDGPQNRSRRRGEEKNLACRKTRTPTSRPSNTWPVVIPTALSRFPTDCGIISNTSTYKYNFHACFPFPTAGFLEDPKIFHVYLYPCQHNRIATVVIPMCKYWVKFLVVPVLILSPLLLHEYNVFSQFECHTFLKLLAAVRSDTELKCKHIPGKERISTLLPASYIRFHIASNFVHFSYPCLTDTSSALTAKFLLGGCCN
jgi:hypothetical protein